MTAHSARLAARALIVALKDEGGMLAELVLDADAIGDLSTAPGPAQIAAGGPRTRGHEAEYELLIELILEGSLLHYGTPRVVRTEDSDLALLLGDQLYALGLERLAALGDLEAVAELADVIALLAQAYVRSDDALADAVWEAGGRAVGWGPSRQHDAAKALARAGDRGARVAMLASARGRRS